MLPRASRFLCYQIGDAVAWWHGGMVCIGELKRRYVDA
jgi:hypothetical protein